MLSFTDSGIRLKYRNSEIIEKLLSVMSNDDQICNIIDIGNIFQEEIQSSKYPIYIFGLDVADDDKIKEIKLYFDTFQFKDYDNVWAENDINILNKPLKNMVVMSNNKFMIEIYDSIINCVKENKFDIGMYGINIRNKKVVSNKKYCVGDKNYEKRIKFISEIHKILFGCEFDRNNCIILKQLSDIGLFPSEIGIAFIDDHVRLKLYYATACESM